MVSTSRPLSLKSRSYIPDIQPANVLLSLRDDLEGTTWLNEPETSPVKWRPGVQADDSAPEYLIPSQIPRGMLDDFDEGTLILRIGDLGGGTSSSHLQRSVLNLVCSKMAVP